MPNVARIYRSELIDLDSAFVVLIERKMDSVALSPAELRARLSVSDTFRPRPY